MKLWLPLSGFLAIAALNAWGGQACPSKNPIEPLVENVQAAADDLADPLFHSCFDQNLSEIPEAELTKIFDQARSDPFTHMKSPEVHCLHRAYLLMSGFFQKGYRPRLLHIEQAPTLIGLVSFESDTPNRYIDYHGKHWVVAIDVRTEDGKLTPQILDPQFMKNPMTYDEYFTQTTGERCHTGPARGAWDCSYEEIRPTRFSIPILESYYGFGRKDHSATESLPVPGADCSWPLTAPIRREIGEINRWDKSSMIPLPENVRALSDPARMREALILKGFETEREKLDGQPSERAQLYLDQYPTVLRSILQNLGTASP